MKGSTKFWLAALWGIRLYLFFYLMRAINQITIGEGYEGYLTFIILSQTVLLDILFLILMEVARGEEDNELYRFFRYNTISLSLWDGIKQFNKFLDNII